MTKRYVIVGASTGLGRETARRLAADHEVIVAGRDAARTHEAVPGAASARRVELADLADVARFCDELATAGPIDGLVCNAGVQTIGPVARTRDGHEATFAVNHLAHFAIVMRLVPVLAPGARVVFVGSGTVDPGDRLGRLLGFRGARFPGARELAAGEGDATVDDAQRGRDRYAASKLCNLLAMDAIARRTTQLEVHALDPGLMPGTGLARERSWPVRLAWHTVARALPGSSSASRSAAALVWLLTAPALAGTTGRYFDYRRRELTGAARLRRAEWADELYTTSLELAGLARDPLAAAA
jgi:NAD(P)-dependent dehydrogenase (short-subunit alcohol dehydrogenase family)